MINKRSTSLLKDRLQSGKDVFCRGLYLSARWFVLSEVAQKGLNFIILPNQEAAEYCASDLYTQVEGDSVFFLPSSGKNIERSNYKSSLGVQRTSAVEKIINYDGSRLLIVTYPEAIEELVPTEKRIQEAFFEIRTGDAISHESITEKLASNGFERVDFVSAPGQFAIRGSIVDIFSYSRNHPFRISFWGDEVEKIHLFDCNTQLSVENCEKAEILSDIISEGDESGESVLRFLPEDAVVWLDSSDMYKEKPFFSLTEKFTRVFIDTPLSGQNVSAVEFEIAPQPVFNKNFELLTEDIRERMESGYEVCIFGEKQSQLDRIQSILSQNGGLIPKFVAGKNIHNGFIDKQDKICCYTDHEIFDRFHRVRLRRTVEKSEQLTINDLNSFNIGDYVVHIDHGVGVFGGLVRMRDDFGRMKEVVKLTYRDGDVVFVSVHALHKISRFRSRDGEMPKINKLGSKTWITLKNNAKSRVKDIAKDLIQLYAKRKASKAYAFSPDTYLQEELESSFMYEDTPDQELASKAVKRDMEGTCPMDRLICGDVGFGKTEIAIRAAFKAAVDGKQTAVLVPTTILALQHYTTFTERLKNLPCTIDYVSRLRTAKELSDIRKRLKEGKIDILIGTHKILGESFEFKDLGLLVIDEEQKFGVSAKEKLRQIKSSVDTLTLTATPIPRTLAMTVYGDLHVSIIDELPPGRKPIQTIHYPLNRRAQVYSFIRTQIQAGRQIYVVFPLIKENEKLDLRDLENGFNELCEAFPEYKISMVHGQMKATDKDLQMQRFASGETQILVATTVIEVGVNVPNATVMMIQNAERFGLSQLHQLRGRVGRGGDQSYCILLTDSEISSDTRKRMDIMVATNDGFRIAEADLQLRGPGDLEGTLQSGTPFDLHIANLATDGQLVALARQAAMDILDKDPLLEDERNRMYKRQLDLLRAEKPLWGDIS